jgi:hypothetical protein
MGRNASRRQFSGELGNADLAALEARSLMAGREALEVGSTATAGSNPLLPFTISPVRAENLRKRA